MAKLTECKDCGQAVSRNAEKCPNCGAPMKSGVSVWSAIKGIFFVVVVLPILGFVGYCSYLGGTVTQQISETSREAEAEKQSLLDGVKLVKFEWSAENSIMHANFTIKNAGKQPVKDFKIECDHAGKSGTKIDSNTRTIYETLKPGESRTWTRFNMGFIHSQAERSGCAIVDVQAG